MAQNIGAQPNTADVVDGDRVRPNEPTTTAPTQDWQTQANQAGRPIRDASTGQVYKPQVSYTGDIGGEKPGAWMGQETKVSAPAPTVTETKTGKWQDMGIQESEYNQLQQYKPEELQSGAGLDNNAIYNKFGVTKDVLNKYLGQTAQPTQTAQATQPVQPTQDVVNVNGKNIPRSEYEHNKQQDLMDKVTSSADTADLATLMKQARQQSPEAVQDIMDTYKEYREGQPFMTEQDFRNYLSGLIKNPAGTSTQFAPKDTKTETTPDGQTVTPSDPHMDLVDSAANTNPKDITGEQVENSSGSGLAGDDLMKLAIKYADKDAQTIAEMMKNRITLAQKSYETQLAKWQSNYDALMDINAQEKDNALEENRLAAEESKAEYDAQLNTMRDNNSRYEGFLKGKFAAAGMLDSSAGLMALGKYLASADANIMNAEKQSQQAQRYFLGQSRQIMTNFFKTQMEAQKAMDEKVFSAQNRMDDIINSAEDSIVASQSKKTETILNAVKDYQARKLELEKFAEEKRANAFSEMMTRATFDHNVAQDALQQKNWEDQFKQSKFEFALNYDLDVKKFDEDTRRFGMQYAMEQQKFAFDKYNADRTFGLQRDEFNFSKYKWSNEFGFQKDEADSDKIIKLKEAGFTNDQIRSYLTGEETIMPDMSKSKYGATKSGSMMADVLNKLGFPASAVVRMNVDSTSDLDPNRLECGQVTNDFYGKKIFKDSFQDKMAVTNSNEPVPGGAFVMDMGTKYGHVGVVEGVVRDKTGKVVSIQVADSNAKGTHQFSRRMIDVGSKEWNRIKGWYDPNISTRQTINKMESLLSGGTQEYRMKEFDIATQGKGTPEQKAAYERAVSGGYEQEYLKSLSGGTKPKTGIQQDFYNYGSRMSQAEDIFSNIIPKITNAEGGIDYLGGVVQRYAPDFAKSEDYKLLEQAERNFINATLRRESGAAIAPSEFESARQQYFPQPGDTSAVIEQKRKNRELQIRNFMQAGGENYTSGTSPEVTTKAKQYLAENGIPATDENVKIFLEDNPNFQ